MTGGRKSRRGERERDLPFSFVFYLYAKPFNMPHRLLRLLPFILIPWMMLTFPLAAQHAVKDGFPNGKLRGVLYEYFTDEQWNSSNFAAPERMKEWQDLRYGMFIHFGITSKPENADLSWVPVHRGMRQASRGFPHVEHRLVRL
jgi:hypothetical protein